MVYTNLCSITMETQNILKIEIEAFRQMKAEAIILRLVKKKESRRTKVFEFLRNVGV